MFCVYFSGCVGQCECCFVYISVAVWSSVNVAGTKLRDIATKAGEEDDPEQWIKCHKDVINR